MSSTNLLIAKPVNFDYCQGRRIARHSRSVVLARHATLPNAGRLIAMPFHSHHAVTLSLPC